MNNHESLIYKDIKEFFFQIHQKIIKMLSLLIWVMRFFLFLVSAQLIFGLNQDGLFLLSFKDGLNDHGNSLSSWNSRDATPCGWSGVTCDSVTRRVYSLDFSSFGLRGSLPASFLCRISSLIYLNLTDNEFGGTLPPEISTCRALRTINLSSNLFVGPIPETLPEMRNLTQLDLSYNNFSGSIPPSFSGFRRLEVLALYGNLLNETIPGWLFSLPNLKMMLLAQNPFVPSPLRIDLGNMTSQLHFLWLSYCNLVGEIPSAIGNLSKLGNLDLSYNGLTGSIPSELTMATSLYQVELYGNSLSGKFPSGWSKMKNLRRLDASMNGLTGEIPDELCQLELSSLNLYDNYLEGPLPASIAQSPYLYELKVYNNSLTGKLPTQLGTNSALVTLDLSSNNFTGQIPGNLCKNRALEQLLMLGNALSGEIPTSLATCNSLMRLRLSNNKLSGAVPDGLWGLPRLYLFDVVQNSLSGSISDSINSAGNMSNLMISRNLFSGSIPDRIGSLVNLVDFSGSRNNFTGHIPRTLVKLSSLINLDLSHNALDGEIPPGIQAWIKLNELNLANNKFWGEIPEEIGRLPALNYLDLSGNYFYGNIPSQLQKLKLTMLNLSYNQLTGQIPPLLTSFKDSFMGNPGLCDPKAGTCLHSHNPKQLANLWILLSIFILAGIVLVAGIVWFIFTYKKLKDKKITMSKWKSFHKLGFSEFEIIKALDEDNVIGSGASGKVYKVVLSNKEIVAVKKLWGGKSERQEVSADSEEHGFEAEVQTLGKIRHKNIVRLWCCYDTGDCKLLVYEYMPNGSLGDLLHGSKGSLDWLTRWKVALDAAKGLSYLHHDCAPSIVHRDIKSNNILLDGDFGAKVSDFGVAKAVREVSNDIESMSIIAGSCGYIAPEYAYTLRVNEKSDIYSFGVVILELVTGKRPIDPEHGERDLVKWVCSTLDQKGIEQVVDPKLDLRSHDAIQRVLGIGLECTSSLPINRPSMRKVVKMLQEADPENKPRNSKKEGELSPYFYEESDQGSIIQEKSS